jgi:DNA-binding HxlR family transcriptional regulator
MIARRISHRPAAEQVLPSTDALETLQGRWTLQILLCVNGGAHRFVDLRAAIPQVSANVLTQRLRALEDAGLIERHYLPAPAARHVYVLAAEAAGLKPALDALADWQAKSSAYVADQNPSKEQSR